MQTAIRDDHEIELNKYMPLIKLMNIYLCNDQINNDIITFRESKLQGNQLKKYKNSNKGDIFRVATFTATTLDCNFLWPGCTIIKYNIPVCKNSIKIKYDELYHL